jgi:hypothetical protein
VAVQRRDGAQTTNHIDLTEKDTVEDKLICESADNTSGSLLHD